MKGGAKVVVEPHRHEGVFIARGKEDALCTLNSAPGKVILLLLISQSRAHTDTCESVWLLILPMCPDSIHVLIHCAVRGVDPAVNHQS